MFFLYHHHDLTRLAELQAALLDRRQRVHPLEADTILVPNHAVGRWLQMQLAEAQGIAANLEMPLPARYIWELLPRIQADAGHSRDFERSRLQWHLYGLLPDLADRDPAIAAYLRTEPGEIQRLQLAERLADVFDQYLIYRPRMLDAWQRETSPEHWQGRVWKALCEKLGQNHRGRRLQDFVRNCPDADALARADVPRTLYCFGLGALPPDYVRFFYALAREIDVHFLLPNPCAEYWGDISRQRLSLNAEPGDPASEAELEQGHPLLASLGRGTRDLLRVLYSDELCEMIEPDLGEPMAYSPPGEHSLLARVQSDIISMRARQDPDTPMAEDVSVQVHACHGPLREVQVLQDQLLDLLGRLPGLKPQDIVVMMPEIGRYAAAIESVFGAARGPAYIPYNLSDRSREARHPIMQSVRQLLDLPLSRWTASDVMNLAGVPAVARRFGLDEPALQQARDWIQAAGVRWGLDGDTRRAFQAGESGTYTWQFGLDRLLLGLMQSDDATLVDGIAPWSDLEGSAGDPVGRIWYFLQRLHHWALQLGQDAPATRWQERLNGMLDDLFLGDVQDSAEIAAFDELRDTFAELELAADCLQDTPLSWEAVRETLGAALDASGERQPFLSAGVSFCGLQPLRAVPFRVVCLLGLDDRAFPRQERHASFNLLRQSPRLGDHDPRDDDRLLFLQALMAARDVFYLSYTGQDANSGERLPPSPLLGEWLDFVHRHHFAELAQDALEQRLICRQPMHPFSARLFMRGPEHPRLFSFAADWHPASRAGQAPRQDTPSFLDGSRLSTTAEPVIALVDLKRFFRDPARWFLREQLQLDLTGPDADLDDEEPLALDNLQSWQLRERLFNQARAQPDPLDSTPDPLWRARALLPPAPLDTPVFADSVAQVNALQPVWQHWLAQGRPGTVDINLPLAGARLTGRVSDVWPTGLRRMRPGGLRAHFRLAAWIDLLCCAAAGHVTDLELVGLSKGDKEHLAAHAEPEQARAWLEQLVVLYQQGHCAPLLFLPELADQYLMTLDKAKGDRAAAMDQLTAKLLDPWTTHNPAADNVYFAKLVRPDDPLGREQDPEAFAELAESVLGPMQQHLRAVDA